MTLARWTAASLAIDPCGETTEDVVLAAVLDLIARANMSVFWKLKDTTGLCLAASTTFSTPMQHGSFDREAVKVIGARIPASAWVVPRATRGPGSPARFRQKSTNPHC
jgi:hypothetical protein